MTDAELVKRVAKIKFEEARGYWVDALVLERNLLRDLAAEAAEVIHGPATGETLEHLRREVAVTRALA